MTGVLEAPADTARSDETMDAASPRRARWSRLRADLRLARRQAWRTRGASALVAALVAIPMVALGGGLVVWASHLPTIEQETTLALGQAQARLDIVSGPDPSLSQSTTDPNWWDVERDAEWNPVNPVLPPLDDPLALLPADTVTLEVSTGRVTAETPGGLGTFPAVIGKAWDPVLAGRFEVLEGSIPENAQEAMVSPGVLDRLDARIGDTVVLTEPAASFTITGIMKSADRPSQFQEVFLPRTTATDAAVESSSWFVPGWQPIADGFSAFNHQGVLVFARDLMLERTGGGYVDPSTAWTIASAIAIVATFIAYLVVLLAGAAFSVSARRQQHALAVAASVGAPRASIFRIVLFQGTVLGLIGGLGGAAIGVALAYPVLAILDDGDVRSFWGFHVPWWGIVGIAVFAVAVGTASALVPARNATRGDVLFALRGARTPVSVRADRPLWGSLLIAVGLVVTLVSGLTLATLDPLDFNHPARTWTVVGIVAGPILFQVGVIVAGHWVLSLLARFGSRLGLAARIAARDAAANPGRVVPAFGAIAACVFIASFAMSAVAISTESVARHYWWQAPEGSLYVSVWSTAEAADDLERAALETVGLANPDRVALVRGEQTTWVMGTGDEGSPGEHETSLFRAELHDYEPCEGEAWSSPPCMTPWSALLGWESAPRVIATDELETALGAPVPAEALRVFRDGGALVLGRLPFPGDYLENDTITLNEWDGAVRSPDLYMTASAGDLPDPRRSWSLPAVRIELPHSLPYAIVLSPATAAEVGFETVPATVIGAFDEPPTQQSIDRVALAVGQPWSDEGGLSYNVENGPPDPAVWMLLILGAAGVLVLGAGAVTLGLARVERRPDDATLTAVGASPRLRRSIAFWQGVVVVGVGSVTGTLAGLIPMWGITLSVGSLSLADTPWPWLAGLAFGLPLAMAVVNGLVPSRHPDLTRRTAIA